MLHTLSLLSCVPHPAWPRAQEVQQQMLAASPKPKPFPRAQHTNPPSPPLSRRSPAVSRPGSAPPPGWAAAAAAAQLQPAEEVATAGPRLLGRTNTGHAAAYWERFGLEGSNDFDGFLQRQEKFTQVGQPGACPGA